MARAQGARAALLHIEEVTYGTSPGSGYRRLPFVTTSLGRTQPLVESDLLGVGRDPVAPILDAITVDGDIVVPMDRRGIGYWLKAAFGAPTTTGAGPYTHVFNSGGWTLPSLSLEKAMPEVPAFQMFQGVCVNEIGFSAQRGGGNLNVTVGCIGKSQRDDTVTEDASAAEIGIYRFGQFQGAIKRNGTALANVVSASAKYSNNLDRIEEIGAEIAGLDPSRAAASGQLVTRFADTTLLTQAKSGAPCSIELSFSDGTYSITWAFNYVFLPVPKIEIPGPGGIQVTFDWMGARGAADTKMCTVTLVNDVVSY